MASPKKNQENLPDLSKLSLESNKVQVSKKKKEVEVVDSWEDEVEEEDEEHGEAIPEAKPISDDDLGNDEESEPQTLEESTYLGDASPFYSSQQKQASRSNPRERPATTMLVANRLIASGTGHRIRRTEEQRQADKEKFEKEKKRKEDERRAREEAEKAKKSVWEDD